MPLRHRSRYLVYSEGGLNGASAGVAGGASAVGCQAAAGRRSAWRISRAAADASAVGSAAGAGISVSPVVSPAPESAPSVYSDGGPSGVSSGAAAHTARDSGRGRHQFRPRRHISCGCPAPRLATRRRALLLSRSALRAPLRLLPFSADRPPPAGRPGRRPEPVQPTSTALPIAACATATGRLRRRSAQCSATSELLARRSTPLADAWQVAVARRDALRIAAHRACIFAAASSDPGRGLPPTTLPLPAIGTIANDPLCFGDRHAAAAGLQHR